MFTCYQLQHATSCFLLHSIVVKTLKGANSEVKGNLQAFQYQETHMAYMPQKSSHHSFTLHSPLCNVQQLKVSLVTTPRT